MPFEKGNSGNPAGKPKGSQNKVTLALKERFNALLDEVSTEQLKKDLMKLKPKERLEIVIKLSEYFLPKLNRTQVVEDSRPVFINALWLGKQDKGQDYSKWSTEDLNKLREMRDKYKNDE